MSPDTVLQQAQEAGVAFKTDPMERMVQVLEVLPNQRRGSS